MSGGVRQVLVVVAGLALAGAIIMLFEAVNSQVYPMPVASGPMTPEELEHWITTLPRSAFMVVLAGYGVGALAGAALAARLAGAGAARAAGIVGAVLLAGSLMNLVGLPHPAWFWPANLLLVLVGTWAGLRLGRRRTT